ncbi:AMP-binding protein [Donghicola tyrosinivorans]|uniref:Acyl-CoA synthetase (AMP-forming)/AMP-acid ligase II n=1 Tax=Donghicola tyrosinivorans TaxID=1652492 RepID=A0A2T0WPZ7_9RHOB|nr:AMP-binding protein [Donghicola tyrosinivorans]PRY88757.1 acyl-CoA synthetase (AMP-forming)/AMP-acid ligase II [Donghicola tyrosinivorans]
MNDFFPPSPFWDFAEVPPQRTALRLPDGTTLSYGAIDRAANTWAARLSEAAFGKRVVLGLEIDLSPEAISAYLGALRCGFPVLLAEPGQLAKGKPLFDQWRPPLTIRAAHPGTCAPITIEVDQDAPTPPLHPDLRLLLSTSGSTGDPKLVRLSAENIASNAKAIAEYLRITPVDCAATTLPLHYSYGLSVLNSYLAAGASLLLTDLSVVDKNFLPQAAQAGVSSLALVPHQFDLLRHSSFTGAELPNLRYITQAGGRLALKTLEYFHQLGDKNLWDLVVMYGQTEAAPRISYVPQHALPEAGDTIGQAIPGGTLWLRDENGQRITTPLTQGELVYEGPNVMMGYAVRPTDLAAPSQPPQLFTGDLAEQTPDGFFRITGRLKRFVKLFGLRLSLDQIEAQLKAKGAPAQAVAINDRLVLLCEKQKDAQKAVQIVCNSYGLPPEAIHSEHLAKLPLLSSGKPDHTALRMLAQNALCAAKAAPSKAQMPLREVFRRTTRKKDVKPQDSFVQMGGDSLSYLTLQLALEERLGHAPQNWETMPLRDLEAMVAMRAHTPHTPATSNKMQVGIDVVLRVLAISMVVAQHATDYAVFGGTMILILLMGFSTARFQKQQIKAGMPWTFVGRMLYPIVPLYFLLLIAYGSFRDAVPTSYLLLLGNYHIWSEGSLLEVYWFVSLYAQIIAVLALMIGLPFLRNRLLSHPWQTIACLATVLLSGIAIAQSVQTLSGTTLPYHPSRGLAEGLAVFCVGWLLHEMSGRAQHFATASLILGLLAVLTRADMDLQILAVVLATLGLLVWHPAIPLPRRMGRGIGQMASASLFVYLVHEILVFGLKSAAPTLPQPLMAATALGLSFLTALALRKAFTRCDDWLLTQIRKGRPETQMARTATRQSAIRRPS